MDLDRLLERFLRYTRVETTADHNATAYPSSPGQLVLGKKLVEELQEIGLSDAAQDEHGIVMATLSANGAGDAPLIAFNAHLDTSPESSGRDVKAQVWKNYDGSDLVLPGDNKKVLRVSENPELSKLIGKTIITTDGTTLLGADDKAGVAAIVEAMQTLLEHPEVHHGPVRVIFTCDEEIGHGVDHVDLDKVGAVACYTLDGSGADTIDVETFSADLAIVTVRGANIHPSIAKGKMVNALRAAATFVSLLPQDRLSPETTSDREGFLHPYEITGGVGETTMRILLRDFDTKKLSDHARVLHAAAKETMRRHAGAQVDVTVTPQYRNMADGLKREPRAVAFAVETFRRLKREPKLTIIRGGTDGSRFTELGLPTPNLAVGQHNPHSPLEWACLEEMGQAVEVIVELCRVWAEG